MVTFQTLPEFSFGERNLRELRESLALKQRIIPFDVTLADANTAYDLMDISTFSPPTMNLNSINPSFEAAIGASDYSTINSTTTRINTNSNTGTYSVLVERNAAGDEYGIRLSRELLPGSYYISAYIHSNHNREVVIRTRQAGITTDVSSSVLQASSAWQRISVQKSISNYYQDGIDNTLHIDIVSDYATADNTSVFVVDDVQIEPDWRAVEGIKPMNEPGQLNAKLTPFVSPLTDRFARWLGEENASISIREPSINEITKVYLYVVNTGIYIDFDRDVEKSGDRRGILLGPGVEFKEDIIVKNKISCINATDTGTPRVYGYVMGH